MRRAFVSAPVVAALCPAELPGQCCATGDHYDADLSCVYLAFSLSRELQTVKKDDTPRAATGHDGAWRRCMRAHLSFCARLCPCARLSSPGSAVQLAASRRKHFKNRFLQCSGASIFVFYSNLMIFREKLLY